ncbi:MAG: LamG domain-containing protein, partial [Armatimonadota bacterium]|nr:LamG domain-containing protein [Armatimonadota bacterium]
MHRRDFLKAGLGATVAGAVVLSGTPTQAAPAAMGEGMRLDNDAPIYQAGPDTGLNVTDAVTLEAWVKADSMPEAGGRILDKSVPGTSGGYVLDTYPGNSLRLITGKGMCQYAAKLGSDHWTHCVGVYSASQKILALYVAGKEVARVTDGEFPPLTVTTTPLRVGADSEGGNRFLGRIRRAAVYGRALPVPEIAARVAAGPENPPAVSEAVAEWVFPSAPAKTIAAVTGTLMLKQFGAPVEFAGHVAAPKSPLALWYRRPAVKWLE